MRTRVFLKTSRVRVYISRTRYIREKPPEGWGCLPTVPSPLVHQPLGKLAIGVH